MVEANFRVAIVDDDPSIRRLVRLLLKRSGYDTVEFAAGAEAREQLAKIPWDLAILDRRLPDMDGLELCQELKSNAEFKSRYVIMLTGDQTASLRAADPPVIARVHDRRTVCDLRTVDPADDAALGKALHACR